MKTIQVENAKTRFFESKEDYLKFKQAWKDFHNSDKLVWRERVDVTPWDARFEYPGTMPEEERTYAMQKRTSLSAEHYMLYNLLRGYEAHRGFSPLTNEGRLNATSTWGGEHQPWAAYECAKSELLREIKRLKDVNSPSECSRKWAREAYEALVLPFGDTLSQGVLVALGQSIHPGFPVFQPEEWKDFTKVEKEEKKKSLTERLGLRRMA